VARRTRPMHLLEQERRLLRLNVIGAASVALICRCVFLPMKYEGLLSLASIDGQLTAQHAGAR
jgi:hypothetical protein